MSFLSMVFPHSSLVKNLPAVQEIQVQFMSYESLGAGNGNPLQYSCLENPMDRRAWHSTVHRVTRVRHDLAIKLPPYPVIRPFVKITHVNYTIS